MRLVFLEETGSTNSWLKDRADSLADGDAVCTGNQTAGRGRLGRSWQNLPGAQAAYSLLIRRPLRDPACLPLFASLAAADAAEALCGRKAEVKWPNDLLLNGKKITGILCENLVRPGGTFFIVGIGLNLLQPKSFFESQGLSHAGSLLTETGRACSVQEAGTALHRALLDRLPVFAGGGFAAIAGEYRARCVNIGRAVTAGDLSGTVTGVDDLGRLVVRTASGSQAVFTGEVTVSGIY